MKTKLTFFLNNKNLKRKGIFMKIKETREKITNKVKRTIFALETVAFSLLTPLVAHANGNTVTVGDLDNASMDNIMGGIIGTVLSIARWVGVGVLVYAIYQIYVSQMDQNPDARTKGIVWAVVGIGLITIKSVLKGIGILA